jgi:hypothetical protein
MKLLLSHRRENAPILKEAIGAARETPANDEEKSTTESYELSRCGRLQGFVTYGRVLVGASSDAAIPLPQGIAPPITFLVLTGETAVAVNLGGSGLGLTSGGPRVGWLSETGSDNDDSEGQSGDERFHDTSPSIMC